MAGIDMLHVPYKGTGQAVTDLLAGQIDVMFAPAQTVMPHVQARQAARARGDERAALDALPRPADRRRNRRARLRGDRLVRPARARRRRRREIVAKLSADANKVLADPEVQAQDARDGRRAFRRTPRSNSRDFIRDDMAKWSKLMKERGITPSDTRRASRPMSGSAYRHGADGSRWIHQSTQ